MHICFSLFHKRVYFQTFASALSKSSAELLQHQVRNELLQYNIGDVTFQ